MKRVKSWRMMDSGIDVAPRPCDMLGTEAGEVSLHVNGNQSSTVQTHTSTMPPLNPFQAIRSLPVRSRPVTAFRAGIKRPAVCRSFADDASINNHNNLPKAEAQDGQGPNMQQQEHVSEEAAKMAKMQGGEGPDMSQGTPVQEV